MFCKKCGKRIPDDALTCENCGTEVSVEETSETEVCENSSEETVEKQSADKQSNGQNDSANDVKKDDKERSEAPKKKKIKKSVLITSIIAAILCVAVIVLTFPYIKNAFAKLFLSSEDYFAYVVKNNSDESAKSIASTLDTMKKSKYSSSTGSMNVEFEEPFHAVLADVTSDVKIGGEIGSFLGNYVDLSVGGLTGWIDEVSAEYEIISDGEKQQGIFDVDINDAGFGKVDVVSDKESNTTYIGAPGYNQLYLSTNGKENKKDNSAGEMIASLPEKELTEVLVSKYIACAAENVGKVSEGKKTVVAGKFSKKVTYLSTEIDTKEFDEITENFIDLVKSDKDIADAIKKAEKDSDSIIETIEKNARELNEYYSENLKSGLKMSIYVDAKGKIIGYEFSANKFEISNYTIIKWFEIGNSISGKVGLITFDLVGDGKLEDDKVKLDYKLEAAGSHMADISIYDLDYKKMKEGLYDAKAQIEFTENVSEIGNILFSGSKKNSVLAKFINVIPDLDMDITLNQDSEDETSVKVNITHKNKQALYIEANNVTGEKKEVSIPDKHVEINSEGYLMTWLQDLDDEKFFDSLENIGAPNAKMLRSGYKILMYATNTSVGKLAMEYLF